MLYGLSAAMGCAAFRALPGEMGGRLTAPPAVRRTLQHQLTHGRCKTIPDFVPMEPQLSSWHTCCVRLDA
jgi:hypothetical protein